MAAVDINQTVTSLPQDWVVVGRMIGNLVNNGIPVTVNGAPWFAGDVLIARRPDPEGPTEYRFLTDAEFDAEFPNEP